MKFFLVEDAPLLRQVLRSAVEEMGGEVAGEADAQAAALKGIEAAVPDVVVLDLMLAEGNGVEVLKQVKTRCPKTRVVVLTNCAQPQYRRRCEALGADGFFDKTTDFSRFANTLAGWVGADRKNGPKETGK